MAVTNCALQTRIAVCSKCGTNVTIPRGMFLVRCEKGENGAFKHYPTVNARESIEKKMEKAGAIP